MLAVSASTLSRRRRSGGDGERAVIAWLTCGGCDGCTMAVLGATSPRLEELLSGQLTHVPSIALVHPGLSFESGREYLDSLERAAAGELGALVLVMEGSLFDNRLAGEGSFSGLGSRNGQPIPVEEWAQRLARQADAVIAIGSCATWGGIPAARGNVTGAMGLHDLLGAGFRTGTGLPVVNVPGCAPNGDTFIETLSYVFLHLGGVVPLDLDELDRPRWLYSESTPLRRQRVPYAEREPAEPLSADCSVPARGWINRLGGCAAVGGACNGCTRPDFPDLTLPLVTVG